MNNEQKQRAAAIIFEHESDIATAFSRAFALVQEIANAPEPEPVGFTNETELDYVRTYEALPVSGAFWPTSDEDACVALYTAPPANNQSEQHLEMVNPPAPSVPDTDLARDAERWLSQRDLELLVTFGMQADDCDADGHTLSKEQTRRLCELGVLRNVGFGRSEMTSFGCVLFDQHWEQSRSLPLRTHAEYAAIAAKKGGAA